MDEKLKEILSRSKRYKDFTLLPEPAKFNQTFKGQTINRVQLHSVQFINADKGITDIAGFCGACSWKNGVITPLDGDSYSEEMSIYGFKWFKNESGEIGLDILVGGDW